MLFAPSVTRGLSVAAAAGLLMALAGCSSGFDVGGCTSPDDIRRGACTPVDVSPNEYLDEGLSCTVSIVSAAFWPGELIESGHVDATRVPDYDAEAEYQNWHCGAPEYTH